jgi:hypothetical protein
MNTFELIVDIEYLNRGLVPPSFYYFKKEDKDSLQKCLSELSEEQQRVSKRKFRKLLRKSRSKSRSAPKKDDWHSRQTVVYYNVLSITRNKAK